MAQYYLLTNKGELPIHMTWNKALLSDEDMEKYLAYQQTDDYIGIFTEDIESRKKVPEEIKMRPFFAELGKGVKVKVSDRVVVNKRNVVVPRYEYQFVIGPDVGRLVREDDLILMRQIAEQFEVPFDWDTPIEVIADRVKEKFGTNEVVVTERQWNESGLRNYERKEIRLKLQPGETERKIVNDGILAARPMTNVEVTAYYAKQKKAIDDESEALQEKLEVKEDDKPTTKSKSK